MKNIDPWNYKTLPDILRRRAKLQKDELLYIFLADGENEKDKYSYKKLDHQAKAIAVEIQKISEKGDRVLMLFPSGMEYIVSLFGCFYSGTIAVPAYPPRRNRNFFRIQSIINNSGATIAMTTKSIFNLIDRNFADEESLKGIKWIIFEDVNLDDEKNWNNPNLLPDDIALLQYTSGSTGAPKGVMVSHKNIVVNSEIIRKAFEYHQHHSLVVSWLPSFHDMGLIGCTFQPLYSGYPTVFMPPVSFLQKPENWFKAVTKYKGTSIGAPNFSYDYCTEKIAKEDLVNYNLSNLNNVFCGAEPIRKETFVNFTEKFKTSGFLKNAFYPCYGLAENTLIVTGGYNSDEPKYINIDSTFLEKNKIKILDKETENSKSFVGCGHVWNDTKVKIVNPEKFIECNNDEVGEIWVQGPSVCKGYWNNPEETERTFNAFLSDKKEGSFLRTGDLGFMYEDNLFVTGRIKDLIIIRGVNHYPHDIEHSTEKCHEALRPNSNAAFSVDIFNEERLVIVQEVERTHIRNLNAEEIFENIRKTISKEFDLQIYAISLIKTGSIFKTSSGKIQRRACKKAFLENSLNEVVSWKQEILETEILSEEIPSDLESVQEWIINWLSRKLNIKKDLIDPEKSILSYGLDSLTAVELEQEVNTKFGIKWSVASFIQENKISALAKEGFELIKKKD